jgi:hypothetical protein
MTWELTRAVANQLVHGLNTVVDCTPLGKRRSYGSSGLAQGAEGLCGAAKSLLCSAGPGRRTQKICACLLLLRKLCSVRVHSFWTWIFMVISFLEGIGEQLVQ